MKLGIMQPYLFPYLGYYQLMAAVDRFVVLDDVTFIKQGWINRNRIFASGAPLMFTLPLRGAGSHVRICDLTIDVEAYPRWRKRFLRTLSMNYARAPQRAPVLALVAEVLREPERMSASMRDIAVDSLCAVMRHLGLPFNWFSARDLPRREAGGGAGRVLEICRSLGATAYYNAAGGHALYEREAFADCGIDLRFVEPRLRPYAQAGGAFVPALSILDILMFNPPAEVRAMLREFEVA